MLSISYRGKLAQNRPLKPGDKVTLGFLAQVEGSWFSFHEEKVALPVWRHACLTVDFAGEKLSLSITGTSFNKTLTDPTLFLGFKERLLNVWDKSQLVTTAETVSQVGLFSAGIENIKCGDSGDIVSWNSQTVEVGLLFQNILKNASLEEVCGLNHFPFILTIPFRPAFYDAVFQCEKLGKGQITRAPNSVAEWTKVITKAASEVKSIEYLWVSVTKEEFANYKNYTDIYSKEPVQDFCGGMGLFYNSILHVFSVHHMDVFLDNVILKVLLIFNVYFKTTESFF
jgi:hypothetical protein